MKTSSIFLIFILFVSYAHATLPVGWDAKGYPDWWYNEDPEKSLIDVNLLNSPKDDALISQGQALWMTARGIEELNEQLAAIGGAGFTMDELNDTSKEAEYSAPLALGQLKFLSSKFYIRFAEIGFMPGEVGWPSNLLLDANPGLVDNSPDFPWLEDTGPTSFYASTIGQAKHLFSWDIRPWVAADSDNDNLSDFWENYYFDNDLSVASGLFGSETNQDEDSYTDLQEFQNLTDPNDFFNGSLPNIEITSGDNQTGAPDTVLAAPLIIRVYDDNGLGVVNAPVVFDATNTGLEISEAVNGFNQSSQLESRTDANGECAVYVKLSDASLGIVNVNAIIRSGDEESSVSFSVNVEADLSVGLTTHHDFEGLPSTLSSSVLKIVDVSSNGNDADFFPNNSIAYSHLYETDLTSEDYLSFHSSNQSFVNLDAVPGQPERYSLSFWVKHGAIVSGSGAAILDNSTSGVRYGLYEHNGSMRFRHLKGSSVASDFDIPDSNVWYHLVITVDHVFGETKIYQNGEEVLTTSFDPSLVDDYPFNWGNLRYPTNYADYRLYLRKIGTAEIEQLYTLETGLADFDGDRLLDSWEQFYGLDWKHSDQNDNLQDDYLDDFDGDGNSNLDEMNHGGNPYYCLNLVEVDSLLYQQSLGDVVLLEVEARDCSGNLVPGLVVTFKQINGTGSMEGQVESMVVTDANGIGRINYTCGNNVELGVVEVTAGEINNVVFNIQVEDGALVPDISSGLAAHYDFEGLPSQLNFSRAIVDVSGNGNDANFIHNSSLAGAYSHTYATYLTSEDYLSLHSGDQSYVSLSSGFGSPERYSLSFWVKHGAIVSGSGAAILDNSTSGVRYGLYEHNGSMRFRH